MKGSQRVDRSFQKARSQKNRVERRMQAVKSVVEEGKAAVSDANLALDTQRARTKERGTVGAAKEKLDSAVLALSNYRDSLVYINASESLGDGLKRLEEAKKLSKPTTDARQILHPRSAGKRWPALPPPASAAANMATITGKSGPKTGLLLAVLERSSMPAAIAVMAFVGLDSVVNDTQARWSFGGAGLALAGISVGLQALPDSYKLRPWQQDIKSRLPTVSEGNLAILNNASEKMVNAYSAGLNGVVSISLAVALARNDVAAVTTAFILYATTLGFAYRAASPSADEKWLRPVTTGLGVLVSMIGISLIFGVPGPADKNSKTSDGYSGQGPYQSTIAFPYAVGLLGTSSFLQSFSAERRALNELRKTIDDALLKEMVIFEENSLAVDLAHPAIEEEKALRQAVTQAEEALRDAEQDWTSKLDLESFLVRHLVNVQEDASAKLQVAEKRLLDTAKQLTTLTDILDKQSI